MTALLFAPFVWVLLGLTVAAIELTRWWERRMAEPVDTYGILWPNGDLEDITAHDHAALIQQGYDEVDAAWDAEIDEAIALTQPAPDYGPILDIIAANEAARKLTDDRLRDWVEGKR